MMESFLIDNVYFHCKYYIVKLYRVFCYTVFQCELEISGLLYKNMIRNINVWDYNLSNEDSKILYIMKMNNLICKILFALLINCGCSLCFTLNCLMSFFNLSIFSLSRICFHFCCLIFNGLCHPHPLTYLEH